MNGSNANGSMVLLGTYFWNTKGNPKGSLEPSRQSLALLREKNGQQVTREQAVTCILYYRSPNTTEEISLGDTRYILRFEKWGVAIPNMLFSMHLPKGNISSIHIGESIHPPTHCKSEESIFWNNQSGPHSW